ncbi:MAG: DNA alkylation repair protein [Oscillospiraceae bacterium]|nr:DNA alkylation repair protein [Oscillospiraceae bacterium]
MIIIKTIIQNKLFSLGESESEGEKNYREFISKLVPTVEKNKIIGVRIPTLRKYAKKLDDYDEFLGNLPHEYFEENNLHAFLIERETNFNKCIKKLDIFLNYIDNWATCDSLKPSVLKKDLKKLLDSIYNWIKSSDTYKIRFGVNLLMSFYLDKNFDSEYLSVVANIKSQEYYVNTMRAWFFATALVKQPEKTLIYIENKILDKWTHNKTIQKAIESQRISEKQKIYLKTLKIK